jgi:hypothetical protein
MPAAVDDAKPRGRSRKQQRRRFARHATDGSPAPFLSAVRTGMSAAATATGRSCGAQCAVDQLPDVPRVGAG